MDNNVLDIQYTLFHDFDNHLYLVQKGQEYQVYSDGRNYEVLLKNIRGEDILSSSVSFQYTFTEKLNQMGEVIETSSEIHEDSLLVYETIYPKEIKLIGAKETSEERVYINYVLVSFMDIFDATQNENEGWEF